MSFDHVQYTDVLASFAVHPIAKNKFVSGIKQSLSIFIICFMMSDMDCQLTVASHPLLLNPLLQVRMYRPSLEQSQHV